MYSGMHIYNKTDPVFDKCKKNGAEIGHQNLFLSKETGKNNNGLRNRNKTDTNDVK